MIPPPSPKQTRVLWFCITALAVAILLCLVGLLLWGLGWVVQQLASVILPLAIAGIIAYLLDPLVSIFARKLSRTWSILLVFLIGLLLVVGLLSTVVPRLISESRTLIHRVPEYSQKGQERIDKWLDKSPFTRDLHLPFITPNATNAATSTVLTNSVTSVAGTNTVSTSVPSFNERAVSWAATMLPAAGTWLLDQLKRIASWFGWLVGLLLVPIYVFYFLREKSGINKGWTNYLPVRESKLKEEIIFVISAINDSLIVFFRGQVLVALCSGSLLTIGFFSMGLNYALLLGVMAGVLGILPYLGVMMSLVPAVALAGIQFGDWTHPLLVVGMFMMVNAFEGLVVSPKIIGDRMALHPLAIMIAVMVGTTLMGGIMGGILAIPLTAALRAIMYRYVWTISKSPTPISADEPVK
ncbi:MAG: hypothetical protein JWM68_1585 [Verrucomicrobiales bacterium]|nr:hypothetical protein [Verrucomicrobiales bacterium]